MRCCIPADFTTRSSTISLATWRLTAAIHTRTRSCRWKRHTGN
jgi:hypothetical protein